MLNYYNTGVTVELGDIVASGVDIWAFDYPTPAKVVNYNGKTADVPFDKDAFQQKIIDHYRFRQIGQETVGRWLHYFRTRIKEVMPYYCQLYEFEAKWFNVDDPLESYNLKEEYSRDTATTGKVTGTNTGTTTTEANREDTLQDNSRFDGERRFSDTPQGSVNNLDNFMTEAELKDDTTQRDMHDVENTSTNSTSSDNTESNSEGSENESYTLSRRGNIGVQPLGTEVKDIRSAFINIDLMVINELKDLFLQVY